MYNDVSHVLGLYTVNTACMHISSFFFGCPLYNIFALIIFRVCSVLSWFFSLVPLGRLYIIGQCSFPIEFHNTTVSRQPQFVLIIVEEWLDDTQIWFTYLMTGLLTINKWISRRKCDAGSSSSDIRYNCISTWVVELVMTPSLMPLERHWTCSSCVHLLFADPTWCSMSMP